MKKGIVVVDADQNQCRRLCTLLEKSQYSTLSLEAGRATAAPASHVLQRIEIRDTRIAAPRLRVRHLCRHMCPSVAPRIL